MPIYSIDDKTPQLAENTWVAPTAVLIGDVHLAAEASIWWNTVIRADGEAIHIGEGSNVQDSCMLHADRNIPLTLGRGVSIGHMVMLHGCIIGDDSLVGIKSVVLNHAVIGKECLIGANTLIPENKIIPDRSLVVGSPGRIIRTLSDEDVQLLKRVSAHYMRNWRRYAAGLKRVD